MSVARQLVLFSAGYVLAIVLDQLLKTHRLMIWNHKETDEWVSLSSGFSAVFIGNVLALLDHWRGYRPRQTIVTTLRCLGSFIGLNVAVLKLAVTTSSTELAYITSTLSIGMWFAFDRTAQGFLLALLVSTIGTFVVVKMVHLGYFTFARADMLGIDLYFPWILYSCVVCFGAIGRQLS
ncbi:insulin-induced protein family [Gorgonomyces haynaldii]|nr:insulin-induced protein family [Gorgonomyces haynaldii]